MAISTINLARLYRSEKGALARLVDRIVRNRTTAEDLVQDTFVRLMSTPAPAEISNEPAYLSRVARNIAIDHRRREKATLSLEDGGIFEMADPTPCAETRLADRQALALTIQAMAALPERTRRALEMHRLGEKTLAEIGVTLGISTSLSGRLVLEGYKAVRIRLREYGID